MSTTSIVLMGEREARQIAAQITTTAIHLRQLIWMFDQGQGWAALGYRSFRAWALAEVDQSVRSVYRQLEAADAETALGLAVGSTPESHLRPLAQLPPDQQRAAWERADDLAGDAPRQAAHVAAAVAELASPDPDRPLEVAELHDLSLLGGWEYDGERVTPAGLPLVQLRNDGSADRLATEERTPGGWRMELDTLRARRNANQLPPPPGPAPVLHANPAPADQFVEAQRQARGAGLTLGWHQGQNCFVLVEADDSESRYPALAWAQCLGRLDYLLAKAEAPAPLPAALLVGPASEHYARAERLLASALAKLHADEQRLLAALLLDEYEDCADAHEELWGLLTTLAEHAPTALAWAFGDGAPHGPLRAPDDHDEPEYP